MTSLDPTAQGPAPQSLGPLDLGDLFDDGNPVGLVALNRAFDERCFPQAVEDRALAAGFDRYMVPAALGGRLSDPWDLFAMARAVSRRSITPVIKYGSSLLAANPVWLWGNEEQQRWLADRLLDGGLACFAVSERTSGSDLRSTRTRYGATPAGPTSTASGAFTVDGEKWPVGNARSAAAYTVLARSDQDQMSLLLVDGDQDAVQPTGGDEAAECLGLWGHDLGGVGFSCARADSMIGGAGVGLVQVLKTLQVTRTAISGLSLGALDTALAIAVRYTEERRLYGRPISQIPEVRQELLSMHLDGMLVENFVRLALRSLVVRPAAFALWSSVAKVGAPHLAEAGIRAAQRVLGARSFLSTPYGVRLHQMATENGIAGIFEGTSHVNLRSVLAQMATTRITHQPVSREIREALLPLCSLDAEPAIWQPNGRALRVTNLGDDPVWDYLRLALETGAHGEDGLPADLARTEAEDCLRRMNRSSSGSASLAQGYEVVWLHLGAAMAAFLHLNRPSLSDEQRLFAELSVARSLQLLGVRQDLPGPAAEEAVDLLLARLRETGYAPAIMEERS